jgi:hypothetical protein
VVQAAAGTCTAPVASSPLLSSRVHCIRLGGGGVVSGARACACRRPPFCLFGSSGDSTFFF